MSEADGSLVVGVDGSPSALDAVRWAVVEAGLRGLPVDLVAVVDGQGVLSRGTTPRTVREVRDARWSQAQTDLDRATAIAGDLDPSVSVRGTVREGDPAAQLLADKRSPEMIVLGTRGRGGFAELLVGSVTMAVSHRATCPVVVVRGGTRPDAPVVVGIDGTAPSQAALGFAAAEAVRRGVELDVLQAWDEVVLHPQTALLVDWDSVQRDQQRALDETVAPCRERYPELGVRARAVRDGSARSLVTESRHAQLVVVGSRGRGAVTGWLGSVTRATVHHADCPVAIVPAAAG